MHLVAPLASGVRGAEEGTAELFRRGTSLHATWYPDFEATSQNSSGLPVQLDSYGGATVFVNELVDVVVRDMDGVEVRRFTAGYSSPAIEVRSQSFTGTDYEDATQAPGNPTTLQSVLDRALASFGAPDWQVVFGAAEEWLPVDQAIARVDLGYVNVRAYGALGDGVANDTAALQAACTNAGAAGGGVVFFPPGSYRHTGFTVPQNVSLLGAGPAISVLVLDHGSSNGVGFTSTSAKWSTIESLGFTNAQINTGALLTINQASGWHGIRNCRFAPAFTQTKLIAAPSVASAMRVQECYFAPSYALDDAVSLSGSALAMGCEFVAPALAGIATAMLRVSTGSGLRALNNAFNMAAATGWGPIIQADLANYLIVGGNQITNLSGAPATVAWSVAGVSAYDLGNALGTAITFSPGTFIQVTSWESRYLSQNATTAVTLSANHGRQRVDSTGAALTITLPSAANFSDRMIRLLWHNNNAAGVTPTWSGITRGDVGVATNANCFAFYELREGEGFWVVVLVENNIPE